MSEYLKFWLAQNVIEIIGGVIGLFLVFLWFGTIHRLHKQKLEKSRDDRNRTEEQ